MKTRTFIFFILIPSIFLQNCGGGHDRGHETIQKKLEKISHDSITYDVSSDDFLKDMNKLLAEVPGLEEEFYIPERTGSIQSFPCSSCHTKPLNTLKKETNNEQQKAHWNIELIHAGKDVMSCNTCHNTDNMDELNTIAGKSISINHSYQLCSQCHSTQYKDWQGGAHGKRLGGWAPPRVVNTCTNCHNPHKPAFDSRWPARLNTVKLKEQQSE